MTKGSKVTIKVSTGKPEVSVPPLVGKSRDDAVKELTVLGLGASVVEVNSDQQAGIVTAQDPAGGTVVVSGTKVRVNVSKGVKQVAVPSVVGSPGRRRVVTAADRGLQRRACRRRERPADG